MQTRQQPDTPDEGVDSGGFRRGLPVPACRMLIAVMYSDEQKTLFDEFLGIMRSRGSLNERGLIFW